MGEIQSRAARRRPHGVQLVVGAMTPSRAARNRTAPLRRLSPLSLPEARSARPGASSLKRVVRRLTAWQIDPIVGQVNRLQQALIDSMSDSVTESVGSGDAPPR